MKKFREEKGAALVLTIMMITLFLVFILGLFTQVTSTTKQVTTMEKKIDAQLVAEMGVTYFQRLVEIKQDLQGEKNKESSEDDELANFIHFIKDELPINQRIDKDRTFKITLDERCNEDKKSICFKSEGVVADANVTATSNGIIVINITEQDGSGESQ